MSRWSFFQFALAEAHVRLCQTSIMELLTKLADDLNLLTVLGKIFIIDSEQECNFFSVLVCVTHLHINLYMLSNLVRKKKSSCTNLLLIHPYR